MIWVKSYFEFKRWHDTMNSEENNSVDTEQDNSNTMTRRDAVKTMLGAAAVIAVAPTIGGLALSSKSNQEATQATRATFTEGDEPFVILVSKDGLRGFKGEAEYSVKDSDLSERILGAINESKAV